MASLNFNILLQVTSDSEAIASALRRRGLETEVGQAAAFKSSRPCYDAIIIDTLPAAALASFHNTESGERPLLICYLNDTSDGALSYAAGADAVIGRSDHPDMLADIIATLLQRRASKQIDLDELEARITMISAIIANRTHEIRNPLTVIAGYLEAFKFKNEPAQAEMLPLFLKRSEEAIKRMEQVVSSLHNLAADDDKNYLELAIQPLMRKTLEIYQKKLFQNKVHLELSQSDRPLMTRGRGLQLVQLISSLIDLACRNIKDHTHKWIKITTSEDQHHVIIRIINASPNPPQQQVERITEELLTHECPDKIELSIASRIAHRYGGELYRDETVSQQTSFILKLIKI